MTVVFGTACVDRFRLVPEIPSPGGYAEIEREVTSVGGEAVNTAVALHAWGEPVALVTNAIGHTESAVAARAELVKRGLDLARMPEGGVTTECDIYVTPDGEKTMFGRGFDRMDETLCLDRIPFERGGWFTADPNAHEMAREAVKAAAEHGMRTYLMDFVRSSDEIPEGAFWQSATDWLDLKGDLERAERSLVAFTRATGAFGILTDGANGLVAGSAELGIKRFPAFEIPGAVDSTGAGDVFRAGMLYGLNRKLPPAECLKMASVAAGLNCRNIGGCACTPTLDEILDVIESQPQISQSYTF